MEVPELTAVNIEIIVDNFIDVFEVSRPGQVERVILGRLKKPVMAAHGLSLLLTLRQDDQETRILMDTANSPLVLFNNLEALERPVDDLDAIFISHGHPDHYGGLLELLSRRQKPTPVYLHPDCYYPKLLITPRGRIGPWTLERDKLVAAGAELHENTGPTLINGMALITGAVEPTVPYETPLPGAKRVIAGKEEHDNFSDEQALVLKVAGQGLVVIGACSHPGIVNMVKYAQRLTGVEHVAAVIGGFHLTAGGDELINNTIAGLKEINPELIFAGHCTGFRALTALSASFPKSFMVSCVGTKLLLG
ncbi:MAG: MBL fold metallo-hydrolase [Desulfobacca sp.]|nr:MBL fold metallo-hydrolase [Desulfobacca sp.]